MAISVAMNVDKLLLALGITQEQIAALDAQKVVVTAVTTGLKFSKTGVVLAHTSMSLAEMKALSTGNVTPTSHHATAAQQAVLVALGQAPAIEASPSAMDLLNPKTKGIKDEGASLGDILGLALAEAKTTPLPDKVFPTNKMQSAERVQLAEATMLYQPVFGTDTTSRYFTVACGQGLNIAARYSGNKLSVRVAGAQFDTWADNLTSFGFNNVNKSNKYASMHFDGLDKAMAAKALGAMVMGLGIQWSTPIPVMSVLVGKGS